MKLKYLELTALLYELCRVVKTNPLSLESHVEKPESSNIFATYPQISKDKVIVNFICDTLMIQISSPMSGEDLNTLMQTDIDCILDEHGDDDTKGLIKVATATILSLAKECAPKVSVEFARRSTPLKYRLSFNQIDRIISRRGDRVPKSLEEFLNDE